MERKPVKSSNIKSIGYDENKKHLHVEFNSGAVFCYEDVSPEEHQALMKADSHGSHFHGHIKSTKKCSRI